MHQARRGALQYIRQLLLPRSQGNGSICSPHFAACRGLARAVAEAISDEEDERCVQAASEKKGKRAAAGKADARKHSNASKTQQAENRKKHRRRLDENYVPAKTGPVDGRAYADWGKLKWRPKKQDNSGKASSEVEAKATSKVEVKVSDSREEGSVSVAKARAAVKVGKLDPEVRRAATAQANALLNALDEDNEDDSGEQHQKLLKVGIIGAPNAGKSCLLNYMVGSKVSAVSRKTNTTRTEILGVLTEGDTQILFYDTPGLMVDWKGQPVRQDTKNRVQSAWMVTDHCDVVIVLVDAHRQIDRPDQRVKRLVDKIGAKPHPTQKRVLCLNKVDLIRNKRELVPLAQELGSLPGFDSVFMISGLRGGGVRHLREYLFDKAVFSPWEEDENATTDMNPVMIAKEVVWEHVLDNLHQEIPYEMVHKHVSWKSLKDGSIRIEQHLVVQTQNQKKILVGKKGALVRKIGMSANEELSTRLGGKKIHLILEVKVRSGNNMYAAVEEVPDEMWL